MEGHGSWLPPADRILPDSEDTQPLAYYLMPPPPMAGSKASAFPPGAGAGTLLSQEGWSHCDPRATASRKAHASPLMKHISLSQTTSH